ncbi:MAG: PAS domain S-box protein [Magnetococcales bacterium]|nr:PAS domain S-box protein [Magnetococcales bacterium]
MTTSPAESEASFTILIIEDNAADMRLLRELLRAQPFAIHGADRLATGLGVLDQHAVHLILLDLGLPDSRGLATLRAVRQRASHVPVIVLTGLDDEELGSQAVAQGAQDYILKRELNRTLLTRTIRYAMERERISSPWREGDALLHQISATSHDAMIALNPEGRILFWNQSAARLFGYGEAEVMGRSFAEVALPQRFRALFRSGFDRFQASGSGEFIGHTREMSALRHSGEEFPVEITISAYQERGRWQAAGIIRDLSARKQSEQMAHCAGQMRIVAELATRSSKESAPGEVLATLETIQGCLDRAKRMARAMRIHQEPVEPCLLPIRPHERVTTAVLLTRQHHPQVTISLEWQGPDQLMADPELLGYVLDNLFDNAVDAMPQGGEIILVVREEARQMVLEMVDTGHGIAMEHQIQLFTPFFSTKPPGQGMGMGLTNCQKIVQRHGGRLTLESVLGQGTRVTVRLPVDGAADSAGGPAEPVPTHNPEPDESLGLQLALTMLSNALRREILQLLGGEEALSLTEITRRLGVTDHTKVHFHLKHLRENGILLHREDRAYQLTVRGRTLFFAIERLAPLFVVKG